MNTKPIFIRITTGCVMILVAVLSAMPLIPPRALSADSPASQFSAGRAMNDLELVAREPHNAGSDAQARVSAYITREIEAVGLVPELETSGGLTNILVRIPGKDPAGTMMISGHYDSHPPAPGAGDDGISTVAMLESLRVLQASPSLANDVWFLFTDGEELGWLGAKEFLKNHPDASQEIDLMLVFDARPGAAPLTLLETSRGDGWMMDRMSGLRLPIWAGSWNNREERNEQDTDFDTFKEAGLYGAVFENEASGTRYHTDRDTVEAIRPTTVQAYGETLIALVTRFGNLDLGSRDDAADRVFFNLPLAGLVVYPQWITLVLSCLGLLALAILVVISMRKSLFSWKGFGWSLLALILGMVVIVLIAQLAWGPVKAAHEEEISLYGGFENSSSWLTGFMLTAVGLMIAWIAFMSRRVSGISLVTAGTVIYLLVWLAVWLGLDADNPLTTAYLSWPLLGGVTGMAAITLVRKTGFNIALLSLAAFMVMALLIPEMWMATYTREDAWIPVLAACLPMGLLAPQIGALFGKD